MESTDEQLQTEPTAGSDSTSRRRHDLDALRAVAMLLGILLHAGLSFAPFPWLVQDSQTSSFFVIGFSYIHGFRMPLFFLLSGFFTAMLWRKRGLWALLNHRFRRIFLPLMVGLVTIVPMMHYSSAFLISQRMAIRRSDDVQNENDDQGWTTVNWQEPAEEIWEWIFNNDVEKFKVAIENKKVDLSALQPVGGASLLSNASFAGRIDLVKLFVKLGADPNQRNADGGSPLHAAAFMGNIKCFEYLVSKGANVGARNQDGSTPLDVAKVPWQYTASILKSIGIEPEKQKILSGRNKVIDLYSELDIEVATGADSPSGWNDRKLLNWLLYHPVWHHLWFLWFLCWLVVAFGLYALIFSALNIRRFPGWLIHSPGCLVWLIPMTMIANARMQPGLVGPDTSIGILPFPTLLAYYGLFFFYGALYWDINDDSGRTGKWWYLTVPLATIVVFPLAIIAIGGSFGASYGRGAVWFNFLESLFAWMMIFGSIGMFRQFYFRENRTMRYVSDSSYWLYVAHLPLVLWLQWFIKDWQWNVFIKFGFINLVTIGLLLLSYEFCVRYTVIGTMLNGKKVRSS
ncbi:MAG: acyltransferase family protein [Planctomycetota bacterium]